jgi:hypothetical protein
MSSDIPFSTFQGQLKQLDTDFKLPLMRELFEPSFSAFSGLDRQRAKMLEDGIKFICSAAGVDINFGFRPRRFAGGPGLPPSRYFVLCDGSFNDRGALRDELTAYYSGRAGITVSVFDPKVEPDILEYLRVTHGMDEDSLAHPLYLVIYRLERPTERNAHLMKGSSPLALHEGIAITYGVRQFNAEIERVIDLRLPETQEWFTRTFVSLERDSEKAASERTHVTFPPKPPLETFAEMLPVLVGLNTGGGMSFGQAVGQWLRQHGANALIYPSARANAFCRVMDGKPAEWGGWCMVVYTGAEPALSESLFGHMGVWRDRDHDHIHVDRTAAGRERGSFSIRGAREFSLMKFDLQKQVAAGVQEQGVLSDVTGTTNAHLSAMVNDYLDFERTKRTIWYNDIEYFQFVSLLENQWRDPTAAGADPQGP